MGAWTKVRGEEAEGESEVAVETTELITLVLTPDRIDWCKPSNDVGRSPRSLVVRPFRSRD